MDIGLIENDPVLLTLSVVEANSVALATIGVIATSKPLAMASLGLLGVSRPTPPTPIVAHGQQNEMLIGVGEMM